MNARRRRSLLSLPTALATVVSYAGLSVFATPARAADAPTTALRNLVVELESFVPGLAGVGELGKTLPTLGLTPGGADGIGLGTLLGEADTSVLGAAFDNAATVQELVDAIDGADDTISDGRAVSFTADRTTTGTVETISLAVHAERTIASTRLGFADSEPNFSFAAEGGVEVDLTLDGAFELNYDTASGGAWITRGASTPSLSIGATASIPDPAAVQAGIGVLAVQLSAATFDLAATVSTSWSDPDNDGRLYFDEPGGAADDGELSAAGAGAGLVTAALASGSMNATLTLSARPSTLIDLGAVDVGITVSSNDLTSSAPQVAVTSGTLDTVQAFLNLSVRDLAQGLAQAATTVMALQNAAGAGLPFMRGDFANAIGAVEAIGKFLEENVPEPTPGSAEPGLPSFASLQDMLEALDTYAGTPAAIDIANALYDSAKQKVTFTLGITRTSATPISLNPAGDAISGTATYTPTQLTDGSKTFSDDLIGRQVVAGTSSAIIADTTGSVLTLDPAPVTSPQNPNPTVYWNGGEPADGTPYSIAAADPKIGAVELGNALEGAASGAIRNANAKVAQASVTPTYNLQLPIVLDLRAPDTTDCDPGPGTAACPFQHTANGITRIIESLPLPADRIMLRIGDTDLLTADAPITTNVDIDATVGFLGVKIKGTLDACTVSAPVSDTCAGTRDPADHLLTIGLEPLSGADADGDISFPAFVAELTDTLQNGDLADLVDVDVNGQAYANLTVEVPGAPAFFGGSAPSASVTVKMADITQPANLDVTPASNLADLGTFDLDADNPLALFGAILANLQAVQDAIGDFPGSGALDQKIPLVGKSFNEIVGGGASGGGALVSYTSPVAGQTRLTDTGKTFDDSYVGRNVRIGSAQSRVVDVAGSALILSPALEALPAVGSEYTVDSELQGLVNVLQDQSSSNLQELLDTLAAKLGVGSNATFEVIDGTPDLLKLKIHWARSYEHQAPLNMKFELPAGSDRSLVGAQGEGLLDIAATGEIDLALLIPLDTATLDDPVAALRIDPTESGIDAGISVNGDGVRLTANLGPFEASLGNPVGDPGTELQAGLGVALASAETSPQTLSGFLGSLDVDVTGNGVSCDGAPVGGGTELALCAVFPTYINGILAGSDADHGNFVVRLPLDESDLADTLNLAGAQVDGHDRLVAPDELLSTLAEAALNLASFGEGFYGYMEFLENALRTASFDGKLPLIGKDLQAGSDFVAELRAAMETALAGVDPLATNAGQIRTFLKTKVEPEMPRFGDFDFDVECVAGATLATVAKPSVAEVNDGDTATTYRYKVVAYTAVDGQPTETIPSDASDPVQNGTLSDTKTNTVTWTPVARADGYRVYRATDSTDDYFLVADVAGQASDEFLDEGAADGAELDAATFAPCPDATPADEVNGFTMTIDMGQGDPSATDGCVDAVTADPNVDAADKACLAGEVPFDLGIPGLSIKSTPDTGGVTAALGWRLHLKVGLNRDDGFFVQTQDEAAPEFLVGASVDVGDFDARLAFINVNATNRTTTPELVGAFQLDLKDGPTADDCTTSCSALDGPGSPRLTLDKITDGGSIGDFVKPLLSADLAIDWHLAARPGTGSALPGISANFLMTWGWTSDAPSDFGGLDVAFNDVKLDAGEFLGNAIKPVVKQIVDVFKPVQPVIDTLFEPIPVISDLSEAVGGDPITIATLAQTFSTLAGGPDLQPFLDVLKNVRDLLAALSGDCGADPAPCITVGSFPLMTSNVVEKDANPATAESLIDTSSSDYDLHSDVLSQVNSKSSRAIDANEADAEHPGFAFPFLDDPASIFGLIVGQDVDLVTFDSGPLTLGFEFQQSFGPVYAPPPVNIVVGGGASVTLRVKAGFDTFGIRTAIERGKLDASILDSLYFATTDDDGKPLPVVQFEGFLQAGASVSAVVIEVGVVGGVKLTISFYWNDPNNDGKFRFSEFLTAALTNPICLFNVGGELSLFIKVFITLGISPFSTSFDFTLIDVVILDFNLKPDCTPPPPKLGGVDDGVLYLFAGKFGGKAQRAPGFSGTYPFDANNSAEETWVIRQVPPKAAMVDPDGPGPKSGQSAESARVTVTALGITETFDDTGGAIHTVVLDGRGYTGALSVTFNGGDKDTPFRKKVVVAGGNAADTIRTGIGEAIVDARAGDDKVTTLERTDLGLDPATAPTATVSGGSGADAITVGNGRDTVIGDRGLVFNNLGTLTTTAADGTTVDVPAPLDPADVDLPADPAASAFGDGADQIAAGLGGSSIYGNGGADIIGTANDNKQADLPDTVHPERYRSGANTVVGGRGSDRIKSGSADDEIYTANQVAIGQDDPGSGDLSTDENAVDTGTGSDTVYGSNAKDFVTTHSLPSQIATVFGGDSDDVIIGGNGTDALYGGRANDYLVAGPAQVSADFPVTDQLTAEGAGTARSVTLETITPPVSAKTLVGGGGKDRIYGVDGPATIYGDHEVDACVRQSDPVSKQPAENPVVAPSPVADRDAADLILGGAGVDTVQAGGGNDHVYTYGAADVACGAGGTDHVFGGSDGDLVYGGTGADELYGESHDDELYANDGDDFAYGGTDADRIQGNDGADFLTGDAGTDLVIGGTSQAGSPDTGDRVYGDTGTDTLVGDNADSDVLGAYPADLAGADPAAGGEDKVYGGEADDIAYGGLANDLVFGGNGADYLEGNNATDTVYGEAGPDDVIGGSSQQAGPGAGRPDAGDLLYGGADDDVVTGDNAVVAKVADGSPLTKGRLLSSERTITPLDLGYAALAANSGGDTIEGGDQADVILAQAGEDDVSGGLGDDYAEGGPDADTIGGDGGDDDLVGGSYTPHAGAGALTVGQPDTGDVISGGGQGDVELGDNGAVLRDPDAVVSDLTRMRGITERSISLYDLDGSVQVGTSFGNDVLNGDADPDVLLGQAGDDRVLAGTASDYAEGGPDADWVEGGDGSDDLVGGSSTILSGIGTAAAGQPDEGDVVWGQAGDDVATGDNAVLSRVPEFNSLTYRVNSAGLITERRALRLLDLSNGGSELTAPDASRFGVDYLSGQGGTDVLLGQDAGDFLSGGSADDYAEGQGGNDTIYGDRQLAAVGIVLPIVTWPGSATADYDADGGADGQDDLLGGSSRPAFRDGADTVYGDGVSDYVLGDNGTSVRTVDQVSDTPTFADRVYTLRYPASLPAGAAKIRHSDPRFVSTRFCETRAEGTCEPAGASGGDTLFGNDGDDFVYGQDGDDTARGGSGDDDMYGELGNDRLFGEDGEDAILGDRGGVRDVYETGAASQTSVIQQPPALTYTSRLAGSVSRVADLLHDVDGDAFVGAGAGNKMVYDGIAFGGDDRIRGGNGHDSLHGGVGDDLVNGDSGGDTVFGADGADVLWGGKGCDSAVDTMLNAPDCYANGVFDGAARGTNDRMVDYVFGGKGAVAGPSVAPDGALGSDVIDWRVRGSYEPGVGCTTSPWPQTFGNKGPVIDPCTWFEMTDVSDADDTNNQHHQGIDWQYGGWDRDVLQADVADNGPNPGDRLLDWNGAYNLFTHCNAAYGGFNDVRELSPAHLRFIQQWAYGVGAGQTAADVTTAGTSAFVETAIVYTEDLRQHGSGKAYPSTPGHFDSPNACAP